MFSLSSMTNSLSKVFEDPWKSPQELQPDLFYVGHPDNIWLGRQLNAVEILTAIAVFLLAYNVGYNYNCWRELRANVEKETTDRRSTRRHVSGAFDMRKDAVYGVVRLRYPMLVFWFVSAAAWAWLYSCADTAYVRHLNAVWKNVHRYNYFQVYSLTMSVSFSVTATLMFYVLVLQWETLQIFPCNRACNPVCQCDYRPHPCNSPMSFKTAEVIVSTMRGYEDFLFYGVALVALIICLLWNPSAPFLVAGARTCWSYWKKTG